MRKKKDNRTKILALGIFVAVIMIGSTFGVIFYGYNRGEEKVVYNKIPFTRVGDGWVVRTEYQELFFNYLPDSVDDIEIGKDIIIRLEGRLEIDTTYDINSSYAEEFALSQYNMQRSLSDLDVHVRNGLTSDNDFNTPIIKCEDSTDFVPVIYFKEANETNIYFDDCIVVGVRNDIDAVRAKDRLLYGLFGILE